MCFVHEGIGLEFAEAFRKRDVLLRRDVLISKEDYVVLEEGTVNDGPRPLVEIRCEVDPEDLRA